MYYCKYYVYALSSTVKNYIYVGLTKNVKKRAKQHNSGENRTTRRYKPFTIILTEEFDTRPDARKREKYLKSGVGKEFLKSLPGTPVSRNW